MKYWKRSWKPSARWRSMDLFWLDSQELWLKLSYLKKLSRVSKLNLIWRSLRSRWCKTRGVKSQRHSLSLQRITMIKLQLLNRVLMEYFLSRQTIQKFKGEQTTERLTPRLTLCITWKTALLKRLKTINWLIGCNPIKMRQEIQTELPKSISDTSNQLAWSKNLQISSAWLILIPLSAKFLSIWLFKRRAGSTGHTKTKSKNK